MATHSSILACRIPWTEETGSLQSMGCKEWDMTEVTRHAHNNLFISVWIYGNVYHTLDDKIIYFIFLFFCMEKTPILDNSAIARAAADLGV